MPLTLWHESVMLFCVLRLRRLVHIARWTGRGTVERTATAYTAAWQTSWADGLLLQHAAAATAANAFRVHCSASSAWRNAASCWGGVRSSSERPAWRSCSVSAVMTLAGTMLSRCRRQRVLSSGPSFVEILDILYSCCCCCNIPASLLLLAVITVCLGFVTSLAVVTDPTIPRLPGNRLADPSACVLISSEYNAEQCRDCSLVDRHEV